MNILIADDDLLLAARIAGTVGMMGHQPTHAKDGSRARAHLETGRFDAAILDVRMPIMSGLDVLRFLDHTGRKMPCLVHSSEAHCREPGTKVDLELAHLPKYFPFAEFHLKPSIGQGFDYIEDWLKRFASAA